MLNNFTVQGNLVAKPETKISKNGTEYASFTVANNFLNDTNFFNCVAFGKCAQFIAQYFDKGSQILLNGRIQIDVDDNKIKHTTMIVNTADFCGSKK